MVCPVVWCVCGVSSNVECAVCPVVGSVRECCT